MADYNERTLELAAQLRRQALRELENAKQAVPDRTSPTTTAARPGRARSSAHGRT